MEAELNTPSRRVNIEETPENYKELYLQRNQECIELRKELDATCEEAARFYSDNVELHTELKVYKTLVDRVLEKK